MAPDGRRDLNRYRSEARAFANLKKYGLCDQGIVPKVYGFVECLDPKNFERELRHFLGDKHFPSAILLEYLPGAFSMNYSKYSEERMSIATKAIQQIHEVALILHLDTYTRNILIVPGPPERVMWIDFDIAVSFKDRSELTAKDHERMDNEVQKVKGLGELLVCTPSSVSLCLLTVYRQKTISSGGPKTHKAFERERVGRGVRVNKDDMVSGKWDYLALSSPAF
jgi:hypothetical protein